MPDRSIYFLMKQLQSSLESFMTIGRVTMGTDMNVVIYRSSARVSLDYFLWINTWKLLSLYCNALDTFHTSSLELRMLVMDAVKCEGVVAP